MSHICHQRASRDAPPLSRKLPVVSSDSPQTQADADKGSPAVFGTDPLINLLIDDRYRVLSRMARGGMASVYIARDERLDRLVALKVMHPHLAESEQFTARFRQEARAAARISNAGVVPVYDQGAFHGQGYLVMELVEGPDLRTFIASNAPLTLGDALDFTEQILNGLAAAHRVGVIHRDLKPENVLVGQDGQLKIADFGLARAASEITLSSTGSILGTVAYLAPEVALRGATDGRTDIYAAGIMLYEMLTGSVPGEDATNPMQMAMTRVNQDVAPPSDKVDWLPREVDDLVISFCSRNSAERPVSAESAAGRINHLRSVLSEKQLEQPLPAPNTGTTSPGAPQQTEALSRYARTTLLPVEPRVVHTSGALVAPEEKQFPPSSRKPIILVTVLMLLVAIALGVWWWWQQYGPGSYVEVPNLVGMSVTEAQDLLDEMNQPSTVQYENSDEVPENDVIRTQPEALEPVHKRDEVRLFVSLGILMLEVPNVVGSTLADAETLIADSGLEAGNVSEEWSETVAEGEVISSTPRPGQMTEHYTPVALVVSKGREPITVPDLFGTNGEEAATSISDLGLNPETVEVFSDSVEAGFVVSTEPEAGSVLHRGDSVTLSVSKGPEMAEVPNVYGYSREEAITILENAGFQVEVNQLAGFFDSVGAQSPRAGEMAVRGSVITITVV